MRLSQKYFMRQIMPIVILLAFVLAYIMPVNALADEMGNAALRQMNVPKWNSKKLFHGENERQNELIQNPLPLRDIIMKSLAEPTASLLYQKPPEGGPEFIPKAKSKLPWILVAAGVAVGGYLIMANQKHWWPFQPPDQPKPSVTITIPWPE